jgi:integrase
VAVDDLWTRKGPDGKKVPSARHGRGKRWRVRWVDPDTGRPRTRLFDKKSDAERHDANTRADISRGRYINPDSGKVTVAEYAEVWRRQQIHADSTSDHVETALRLHIRPLLGDLTLSAVRAGHIRSWVKDRSAPGVLAPSSLTVVYGYVAGIFRSAVHDRLIGETPCLGIALPKVAESDRYIPTVAEIHAVAAELPEWYRPVVWVAAGCGLRSQEIFGLELGHVDWLRRELAVRQQARQATGRKAFVGKLKTRTSRRIVELPVLAQEALARHVELRPPKTRVMWDLVDPNKPVEREVRLLFPTTTGAMINRSGWSVTWRRALARADAKARAAARERGEKDPEGVTQGWGLHSLRHFFATRLIHGGVSVKTVQLALGHSKPSITLDTYTHEWPDAGEQTRSLIDGALVLGDRSGDRGHG